MFFNRTPQSAFTLIELLVVLAIITLLIALLLPVLGRSKALARITICQSNMRQMYLGIVAYSMDNDDRIPDTHTLGGYWFRRAPGTKPPASEDPFALPERFGLAATLDTGDYLPGNSEVWVCAAQPSYMQNYGNTYYFTVMNTSFDHYKTLPNIMEYVSEYDVKTPLVRDNYFALPYTTAFRAPRNPGAGFLIPRELWQPPHSDVGTIFDSDKAGGNKLMPDGQVLLEHLDK